MNRQFIEEQIKNANQLYKKMFQVSLVREMQIKLSKLLLKPLRQAKIKEIKVPIMEKRRCCNRDSQCTLVSGLAGHIRLYSFILLESGVAVSLVLANHWTAWICVNSVSEHLIVIAVSLSPLLTVQYDCGRDFT